MADEPPAPARQARRKVEQRRSHQATLIGFVRSAVEFFPGAAINADKGAKARALAATNEPQRKVWIDGTRHNLVCFLSGGADDVTIAVRIGLDNPCSDHLFSFIRTFTKVFDTDLVSAPRMGRDDEAWLSLEQTRLARVIARLASFSTAFFAKCLRTMEAARELTYEGEAFATRLLVTNEVATIANAAGDRFRPLRTRRQIDETVAEKWVRAFTRQGTIALVVASRRATVAGVLIVSEAGDCSATGLHASIDQVERFVAPGVAMIAATQNGDIWVRLGNGMAFLRRRGHWQFFDLSALAAILAPKLPPPVVQALIRLALDASFERHGALFGVLADPASLNEVVPDAVGRPRANRGLRELVAGLEITNPVSQPVIRSAAMIDGAVLLTADGVILDAACIAVEPSTARRNELGIAKWPAFPGARTTAARNISVYGVAIKVSDDGPIAVFVDGVQHLEIG